MYRLIQEGRLSLSTPIQSVLKLRRPDGSMPGQEITQKSRLQP